MRLAIDPGKATGVAWRGADGSLRGIEWPGEDIRVVLDGFHAGPRITELVVETFISRPGPAINLSAPETIGRIRAWADERGLDVVLQTPSAAKTRVTDDRLRAAGGWLRGLGHARDAVRHLLLAEDRAGELDLEQWPKSLKDS